MNPMFWGGFFVGFAVGIVGMMVFVCAVLEYVLEEYLDD